MDENRIERDNLYLQDPVTDPRSHTFHLQSLANQTQEAARRASDMLQQMECLKTDIKMLLTQNDAPEFTLPAPDCLQIQQNQPESQQSQSKPKQDQKPDGPSMLEEAGQVLRQAQRRKKVLEDNLEALLKAKTGEILHCQLEALAANREVTEGVRIKKTVDAWISALTRDVQDHPRPLHGEMPPVDAIQCRAANATKSQARASGRGKPMTLPKGISNKPGMGRGSRGQIAGHRAQAEPVGVSGNLMGSQQDDVDGEPYLTRLYGKLPYEGLRRTLKKSPYPRFSSPASPLGRKPCPRLVESIRGVKLKSYLHESDQFTVTCAESPTGATAIPLRQ
ncbi:hypothetical protein AMECASPLE_030253 [Ameca splendens]|uniref:Protein TALPID3 n=1 Tax=Ameca splendens TaxID=208324 RepID=A0ABV0ZEQ8_9TELE